MAADLKNVRSRRWFHFSLRTLLVFVTVVCVALGLYVKRERDRYTAIESIKRWGGQITFSATPIVSQLESSQRQMIKLAAREGVAPNLPEYHPQSKGWLRRMFGKHGKYHGSDVYGVEFYSNVYSTYDPRVDLAIFDSLTEIKHLTLSFVSGASMSKLPRFPRLESLTLLTGQIDDACMESLRGMPRLIELKLPEADLTSRGMAAIGSCSRLTSLDLSRCYLVDAGFAHFTHLPLQMLMLRLTTTSDAAVPYIAQLKGLKELNIQYTQVTEAGVRQLKKELPNCRIEHDCHWLERE